MQLQSILERSSLVTGSVISEPALNWQVGCRVLRQYVRLIWWYLLERKGEGNILQTADLFRFYLCCFKLVSYRGIDTKRGGSNDRLAIGTVPFCFRGRKKCHKAWNRLIIMINLKQLLVFVQAKDNAIADTYFGDIHLRRKWCFVCHSLR